VIRHQRDQLLDMFVVVVPHLRRKLVVESKADMKKRGMRSPDLADAFLLTFACGERRKKRYRRPGPRNYSAWAV
jgi:hypothetical protein